MREAGKRIFSIGCALLLVAVYLVQMSTGGRGAGAMSVKEQGSYGLSGSAEDSAIGRSASAAGFLLPVFGQQIQIGSTVKIESVSGQTDEFNYYDMVKVTIGFRSNGSAPAGSYTEFQLPDELLLLGTPDFPVKDSENGHVIGTASFDVKANTVRIEFNQTVENAGAFWGELVFSAEFNTEVVTREDTYTLWFYENGKSFGDFPVFVKFPFTTWVYQDIIKKGERGEGGVIKWTVVANFYFEGDLKLIKDAVVRDTIGKGHQYVEGSYAIEGRTWMLIGPDGKYYTGGLVKVNDPPELKFTSEEKNEFEIELGDIDIAYIITYETQITDPSVERYYNTAELLSQNSSLLRTTRYVDWVWDGGGGVSYNGSLTLLKVDAQTDLPLSNAEFTLTNSLGQEVARKTTGPDGKITFSKLAAGATYTLEEVQTPGAMYERPEPIKVAIPASGGERVVKISNQRSGKLGIIEIRKWDPEGYRLSGATFVLFRDAALTELVGDNEQNFSWTTGQGGEQPGTVKIHGIPEGTYYLMETEAPTGYKKNTQVYPVQVQAGKVAEVVVTNQRDELEFIIIKEDEDTGERLPGAEFIAYRKAPSGNWTEVMSFTTGPDGTFHYRAIEGEYRLWENKAPDGYLMPNRYHTFTITRQDVNNGSFTTVVSNGKKDTSVPTASVQVYSHLKENPTKGLEGGEYKLYKQDEGTGNWNEITEVTTDSHGYGGVIGDLDKGTYLFSTMRPPEGYRVDEEPGSFPLDPAKHPDTVEVRVPHVTLPGELRVVKYDGDTYQLLEGAAFSLKDSDNNVVFDRRVTGADGVITQTDLPRGEYLLEELEAPGGYDVAARSIPVIVDQTVAEVRVPNLRTDSDAVHVHLVKHVQGDPQMVLAGAQFNLEMLTATDGWKTQKTGLTTGSGGDFYVHDIAPGTYRFRETRAPAGYAAVAGADGTGFIVEEKDAGKILTLLVPNQPVYLQKDLETTERGSGGGGGGSDRIDGSQVPAAGLGDDPTAEVNELGLPAAESDLPQDYLGTTPENPGTGAVPMAVAQTLLWSAVALICTGAVMMLRSRRERYES